MSSLFGKAVEVSPRLDSSQNVSTKGVSEKTTGGTVAMTSTSVMMAVSSSPDSRLGDRTMLEEDEEWADDESTNTRDLHQDQSDVYSVVSSATDATPVGPNPPRHSTLPSNRQMQTGIHPSPTNSSQKNLLSKLFTSMEEDEGPLDDERDHQSNPKGSDPTSPQQQRQQRRTLDGPPNHESSQKSPKSFSDISGPSPGTTAAATKHLQRRDSRRNRSTFGGFEETTTNTINKANDHLKLAFSTGGTIKPSEETHTKQTIQRDTIVSQLMYNSNENSKENSDDDGDGNDEDNQVRPITRFSSSDSHSEGEDSKDSDGSDDDDDDDDDDDSFAISAVTGATTFSEMHNNIVPELRRLSVHASSQKSTTDSPQPLQLRRLSTLMATSQKSTDTGFTGNDGKGNDNVNGSPLPDPNLPSPTPKQELRRLSALVASKKEEVRRLSKLVASQKSNMSQKSNDPEETPKLTLRRLSTLTASQKNNLNTSSQKNDDDHVTGSNQPSSSQPTAVAAPPPPSKLLSNLFSTFEDDDMEEPSYSTKQPPHTSSVPAPTTVSSTIVGTPPGMPQVPIWLQQQQQHGGKKTVQDKLQDGQNPIWFTPNTSSNSNHHDYSGKSQISSLARSGPLVTPSSNPFKGLVYAGADESDPVLTPYVPTPISKVNTPIATSRVTPTPGPRPRSGLGLSPGLSMKTARSRPTTGTGGTATEDPHLSPFAPSTTPTTGTNINMSRPTTSDTTIPVDVTPTMVKAQTALLRRTPRVRTPVAATTPSPAATTTASDGGMGVDNPRGGSAEPTEIKLRRRRL